MPASLAARAREPLTTFEACTEALRVDQLLVADASLMPPLDKLPDRLALGLGALGLIIGLSLTWPKVRVTSDQWLIGFGLYSRWAER